MKKPVLIFGVFLVSMMLLSLFSPFCYAEEEKESTVYASDEEIENIYRIIQENKWDFSALLLNNELEVLKESITPVYFLDTLDYARSGIISINRSYFRKEDGLVYTVKLIDKNKKYAGNMIFYIKDNMAGHLLSQSVSSGFYRASCSYADHAERIRKILGREEIIPISDVRYVIIDGVGNFFYVKNNGKDYFIAEGYILEKKEDYNRYNQDISILDSQQLKVIADNQLLRYEQFLLEKEQWEKDHPGEIWDYTGDNSQTIVHICSEIQDIVDIPNYFNSVTSYSHSTNRFMLPVVLGCLAFLTGLCAIVITKRRKKNLASNK